MNQSVLSNITVKNQGLRIAGLRDGEIIFTSGTDYLGVYDELTARLLNFWHEFNTVVITGKNEDGTYSGYIIETPEDELEVTVH